MRLTPKEIDKLLLHNAGFLAQKRYARGLKLNYPESVALLSAQLLEFIRDGDSVAELMDKGKRILGIDEVMPGVAEMAHEVQVEGTFPDGTKLVTVHHPICREYGEAGLALYASGLEKAVAGPAPDNASAAEPGQLLAAEGEIELNAGRPTVTLVVVNTGDRPVQVGSHYPFFEANPELRFDRGAAYGMRLDIPSGTAVRFEPGEEKTVELVEIAGHRRVFGGNGLSGGAIAEHHRGAALQRAVDAGFLHSGEGGQQE